MPIHLLIPGLRRLAAASLLLPLCAAAQDLGLPDGLYAEIWTPKGTITCRLAFERAPMTVANFVGLAEGTLGPEPRRPFFDNSKFHRVVPGFVIQGGDPLGTGMGGPGYAFPDEFGPGLGHRAAGFLSMANNGPDTNGSQFFITLAPAWRLNYIHSVFGWIVRGSEVPAKVARDDAMRVRILRIGAAARAFRADEAAFLALCAKARRFGAYRVPGPMAHFDDPDKLLPANPPGAQYFNLKLGNIERASGLRIYARVFAAFAPTAQAGSPEAFADGLARTLGLQENGMLAVYFASTGKWVLSVGKTTVPRFTGQAADPQKASSGDPLAPAMDMFLAKFGERERQYLQTSGPALTKNLQTSGEKIKISVDAFIDQVLTQLAL